LENEIMCHGPETVAAFLAEPVSGTSLCGAVPREDYFKRIREICDRHNVLLILDEVMTGFGRTGKWFGYEHFGVKPDIMAMGKGLGGGYFPIGAAAVSAHVVETIAQKSGIFAAGFSWAGNPMGAAVVSKAIDYLKKHNLVERCHQMGTYLAQKLQELTHHPTVGDVRGMGLMRGLEFVADKETKRPIDPGLHFSIQLAMETLKRGLAVQFSAGSDRGQAGDMIFLGPPFIIAKNQIDDLVAILDVSLTAVEKTNGFV
jgi:adenosylmethionine-8-amino-7-oxononanoate aminotransferase